MKSSILIKKKDKFFVEDVSIESIIEKFATPTYIYSKKRIFFHTRILSLINSNFFLIYFIFPYNNLIELLAN